MHLLEDVPHGAPRIAGFDYRGLHRYSLTVCVQDRKPVFTTGDVVARVLDGMNRSATIHEFKIHVYCFMPDHVHLLVEGESDDADLPRFVKAWKQKTGFDHSRRTRQRLWQVGFYDHVLRSDESTYKHVMYILGNPLRAGLARVIGQYPFAACNPEWIEASSANVPEA